MTYLNPGSVLATAIIFIVLGTAAVAGRFYQRRLTQREYGLDDWLILPAWFLAMMYFSTMIAGDALHTEGWHSPPAPNGAHSVKTALPPQQVTFKKIQYIVNMLFVLIIGFIRLSILCFYKRIFRGRTFDILYWVLFVAMTLWTIIFFFTSVFQCGTDFSAFWGSFADNEAHCFYIFGEVVAIAISDVILDAAILILPIPFVWALQMSKKQKFGISLVLLIGAFSIAAGAVRLAMNIDVNFLHHPGDNVYVLGQRPDDVLAIVGFTLFWQMVQVGVALVVANLVTLRPVFKKIFPERLLSSIKNRLVSTQRSGGSGVHKSDVEPSQRSHTTSFTSESALKSQHSLAPADDIGLYNLDKPGQYVVNERNMA